MSLSTLDSLKEGVQKFWSFAKFPLAPLETKMETDAPSIIILWNQQEYQANIRWYSPTSASLAQMSAAFETHSQILSFAALVDPSWVWACPTVPDESWVAAAE